jgi:acyl dehydratase
MAWVPPEVGARAARTRTFVGDTVTAEVEVVEARADKPITRLRCMARRDDGIEVLRGDCLVYTMQPG